jgi:polyisoprenoid-binding protein YceI
MSTTLQQVPAGTYNVDPIHSTIGFSVNHLGISAFRTGFASYTAQLVDGVLTGTAEVDSIQIDLDAFKGHLLSGDFFDAEGSPTITFTSTEIRPAGDGSVEIDGDLTIRGITQPLSATGTFATGLGPDGSERVGINLEGVIDRRAYGLEWNAEVSPGTNAVGWDVTLTAHLELVKA